MNPSPIGGFASGIAGGISGASMIIHKGNQLKQEKELHAANMRLKMGFEFYGMLKGNPEAQLNVLKEYVMPAFLHFGKVGTVKYSEEQINKLFSNLDLKNKSGKAFVESAANIFRENEKGEVDDEKALKAFDVAVGTYEGNLSGRQEEYLKQTRANKVATIRKKEMQDMLAPLKGRGEKAGQPSPLMGALKKGFDPAIAGGIGALMEHGVPFQQAAGGFPKKKTVAAPTTPMYMDKRLSGGMVQKMKYNPQTKKHDIAFGESTPAKEGHCFRLGHDYYQMKNGKSVLVQNGSIDEKAIMISMKAFGYNMMSESDQIKLVARNKRRLQGKGKTASKNERTNAEAAIAAGFDPEAVEAMYKQRTGKEY